MVITAGVFAVQYLLQVTTGFDILFLYAGKINMFIMQGQVWRLLTPALLHGGILHLALNMYALFIIGSRLERFYGPGRFLLLYVFIGFFGECAFLCPYRCQFTGRLHGHLRHIRCRGDVHLPEPQIIGARAPGRPSPTWV
jgi:membrane associated rhomboid family serine protease